MAKESKEYVGFKADPEMVDVIDRAAHRDSDAKNRVTRSKKIREYIESSPLYQADK